MIVGIGCDIVDNLLTSKLDWRNDDIILNRMFSKREIDSCPKENIERYYSSRFAIKEAILKCLKTGMQDGISLKDIELIKQDSGSISAKLKGKIKTISEENKIKIWHISLSHSQSSSVVFVIAES